MDLCRTFHRLKPKVMLEAASILLTTFKRSFQPLYLSDYHNSITVLCRKYNQQGGRTNVVVYDDGLQLISQKERYERKRFYKKHNVGYVARPGAGRRGRFKKASNLNFGMNLGLEIERRVATGQGEISYKAAMKQLKEVHSFITVG